jgi:hypothetical protein
MNAGNANCPVKAAVTMALPSPATMRGGAFDLRLGSGLFSHGAAAFVTPIDDQSGTRSDLWKLADVRHFSFAVLAGTLRQVSIFR